MVVNYTVNSGEQWYKNGIIIKGGTNYILEYIDAKNVKCYLHCIETGNDAEMMFNDGHEPDNICCANRCQNSRMYVQAVIIQALQSIYVYICGLFH